jgi:cell division protein FtsL
MNDIQDKVMQANGINQNTVPDRQRKGIQDLIRREKKWLLITKILTGVFWIASLIILGCYMSAVKNHLYSLHAEITDPSMRKAIRVILALETVLPLTIIIATICSVFLYIRAKSLNLLQVHERLQNLEEMVKVLLSK